MKPDYKLVAKAKYIHTTADLASELWHEVYKRYYPAKQLDTLVEALPLQPLCREDCRGLCSQCGVDLNEHPDHHHDVTDLRFAALAGLKAQLEAEEHGDK